MAQDTVLNDEPKLSRGKTMIVIIEHQSYWKYKEQAEEGKERGSDKLDLSLGSELPQT